MRAVARREAGGCIHLILVNNENAPVRASVTFSHGTPGIFEEIDDTALGLVPFEKGAAPQFTRHVSVKNGSLSEWLPSWGTQVFRFNGTSDCAAPSPPTLTGRLGAAPNLVENPSFELSPSYVAQPQRWGCGAVTSTTDDRFCFSDASSAKQGRRSGKFITGAQFGSLRVGVPFEPIANCSHYNISAWVRGDCEGQAIALKKIWSAPAALWLSDHSSSMPEISFTSKEEDVATVQAESSWQWLSGVASLETGDQLGFAVSRPGVFWVDDVVVRAITCS